MLMLAWKVAPALATGCTAVVKPAEQTQQWNIGYLTLGVLNNWFWAEAGQA
jgi:aldehyde dehydrogenase (NAD+)/aldehyde dehydrogenase